MDFKCVIKKENGEFIEGTIEGKNGHQYIVDVDNHLWVYMLIFKNKRRIKKQWIR